MSAAVIPLATLSDEEIRTRLAAIVADSLRIDPARVTMTASLTDLGAESIDIVEITLDVEHAFTVLMPERNVLELAAEVGGADTFVFEERLTEAGSAMLRARMPEADPAALAPGALIKELTPQFLRVDVWVRLIRGLLEFTPRACPECHGRLVQGAPAQVKCAACRKDFDVPSGDDAARAWLRRWLAARNA